MDNEPLISVKNIFLLAFTVVISFELISLVLGNYPVYRTFFGDITSPLIELMVVFTLYYVTVRSSHQGRHVQIAWMFMTVAVSFYAVGDIIWAILELGYNQNPFPSVADIFYLTFYPLFAIGIYYLPRFSFTRSEKIKIFIDIGIIIITIGLIFWTFLIIPALSSNENLFSIIITIIYIIGDFLLLFVLLRLLNSKFEEDYAPVILLGMGVLVLVCTDTIFSYQTLHETYISGGLLDAGWILSFILVGLAAFLQASEEKFDLESYSRIIVWLQKSNLLSYIPLIWVLIAFTLLSWANENESIQNLESMELAVGFIIFLIIVRQAITLNENKNLYMAAEKEIKNRKIAENAARESETYYRTIFENTGTAIIIIDEDMKISRVNSEVEKLTGFSMEEIEGRKKWTEFVVEEDLDRLKEYYELRYDSEAHPNEYETRAMDKEGNIKDLLVTIVTIPDTKNQLASILDITKRKKVENKLIESEKRFRNLIYNSNDLIRILDDKGLIVFDSPSSARILGYPEGYLVGKSPLEFIHPDDQYRVKRDLQEVYENRNPGIPTEFRIRKADGTYLPVESVTQNMTDVPSIAGIVVTTHPIKERKEMEDILRESEEKYRNLFESDPDYTLLLDLEGTLLEINNAAVNFTGKTRENLIGKKFLEIGIFPAEDNEFQREIFSQVLEGQHLKPFPYSVIDKNGDKRCVESQLIPLKKYGKVYSVMVIATDITERKIATDKLKASVKEKEILIQEIHHRVKNNMQIISSLLNLQSRYVKDDEAVDVLKESQHRVKSMAMIHEKLYQSKDLTHINFVDYIQSLVSNLFYSYNIQNEQIKSILEIENINLNMETAVPCGLIINELVSNCLKYAFPNGRKGQVGVSLKSKGDKFELKISDNGIGFPESIDFKNTDSLGLQLVNNLVDQIDGEIELDKRHGTEFKIIFIELIYRKRM